MATPRNFIGGTQSRSGVQSAEDRRFFLETRNKLTKAEQFKYLRDKQMKDRTKSKIGSMQRAFALPGAKSQDYKMSKSASDIIKQMEHDKARKERKKMKTRVLVKPKNFSNGRITKDGKFYDVAGNIVGKVNKKTGLMTVNTGASIGKYNPKAYITNVNIQNAINTYSPYFINLRKMQAMQLAMQNEMAVVPDDVVYIEPSSTYQAFHMGIDDSDMGSMPEPAAQTNVWGSTASNVWGTGSTNVWGTAMAESTWGSGKGWGGGGFAWGKGNAAANSKRDEFLAHSGESFARLFSFVGDLFGSMFRK